MSTKKLVIVSELFYPDPSATAVIMSKIAEELSKQHKVVVICGPTQSEGLDYYKKIGFSVNNLKIIRVPGTQLNKKNLLEKIVKQFLVVIRLGRAMLMLIDANTKILAVTNPPLLPVMIILITLFRKNEGTFLLIHDLFPDNAFKMGLIRERSMFGIMLKKLFVWSYKKVDDIIVIGRDMQLLVEKMVAGSKTSVAYIPNWSDPFLINSKYSNEDVHNKTITLGYAGNMGRAQGLLDFSSIIKRSTNKDVRFVFAGDGALSERLREDLQHADNIQFDSNFVRQKQADFYNNIDVAIVLLSNGMLGLGVPSKTYNLIAAGLPILFVGPRESEIYRLVADEGIGWAFDWSEKLEIIITKF